MNRTLRVPISGLGVLVLSFFSFANDSQGQTGPLNDIRVRDADAQSAGGIAGVGYVENFESGFQYGYGCGQGGWTCPPQVIGGAPPGEFEIIDHSDSTSGHFSLEVRASGHGFAIQEARSPIFPLETGSVYADIVISDATSLFQFITLNMTTGNFNTRVNFELDGSIRVAQIAVPPPCSAGGYHASTGSWTPGVKMRIGIEVLPGSVLRVYKIWCADFSGPRHVPAVQPEQSEYRHQPDSHFRLQ